MKKIIKINTFSKQYKIIVGNNSLKSFLNNEVKLNKKTFIIIDKKISYLIKNIKKNNHINIIKINGNEKVKSFSNYSKIMLKLLELQINRHSVIIAIGGGTIGDLSGFIASTILRGVKFILIPTTLLSQVDSSIGGKNGINTTYGKNLIGTFAQPHKVIIDPMVLKTLQPREIRSGYAEILKHSLIKDTKFYEWLNKNYKKVINLKPKFITKAIIDSIKIKSCFVENDEKEIRSDKYSRKILNFGHTFGHALETMNNYGKRLTHGEAIAIGMAFAAKISYKTNSISNMEYNKIIKHLKDVGLPYFDKRINNDKIYNIILSDKKNSDNKINLILLKKIGKAYFKKGFTKTEIKKLIN